MRIRRTAFTLVELLVVIAIIGILVGLLLPAVMSAMAQARLTQCENKLRNLTQATKSYVLDEGHYPAYVDKYGFYPGGIDPTMDPSDPSASQPAHVKVGGWGVPLLKYLDQQPIYDQWTQDSYSIITRVPSSSGFSGQNYHPNAAPNLDVFMCPADLTDDGVGGLSSYITNNGMAHLYIGAFGDTPDRKMSFLSAEKRDSNGLFIARYLGFDGGTRIPTADYVSADAVEDGLSNTAMLSENCQALPWHRAGILGSETTPFEPNSGSLPDHCLENELMPIAGSQEMAVHVDVAGIYTDDARDVGLYGFKLTRSKYTTGMTWQFADASSSLDRGVHFPKANAAAAAAGIPMVSVGGLTEWTRISSRGQSDTQSLMSLKMLQVLSHRNNVYNNNQVVLARPASFHPGGVINMGFCDGSVRRFDPSLDYRVYQGLLTPRGKSSYVPFAEFVVTDQVNQ